MNARYADRGATTLEVQDDGRGPIQDGTGTGLGGLADRIHAVGGILETGRRDVGGFRLRVQLGGAVRIRKREELAK
jgi:signal transduction histidine kinase